MNNQMYLHQAPKVADTSKMAFKELDTHTMQSQVLKAIARLGPTCIADCAAYLHWERSTVSARINELHDSGHIIQLDEKIKSKKTGIKGYHYVRSNKDFRE